MAETPTHRCKGWVIVVALTATLALLSCGGGGSEAPSPPPPPPPAASAWRVLASMDVPRQESGVALLNGEVYVVGGFNSNTEVVADVDVYNPATDRWRKVATLPQPLHHPNVAVVGGRLYVTGAMIDLSFVAVGVTLEYDPTVNNWRARASMPLGTQRGAAATAVIDNRIYVAGGLRGGNAVSDFSVYDPFTDSWQALPAMPTVRDHLVGAAVGGRLYAIGGRTGSTQRAQVEIFDSAAGTWSAGASMPTARGGCMGAVINGRILIVGGEGNGSVATGIFSQSELYDPTSNLWTTLEPMRTPRHGTGAAALDGELFVPGGATTQGFGAVATNEALRP